MKWKDQKTKRLFEWVAAGIKVRVVNLVAVILQIRVGEKIFAKRINPEDAFPPEFPEFKEILGVVRVGLVHEFMEAVGEEKTLLVQAA